MPFSIAAADTPEVVTSRVDGIIVLVENLRAFAGDDDPVALFQIGDLLRQRGERQRVRTQIGFALAIAHHQRRAEPRADQQVGKFAEGNRQRKGTAQAGEHGLHRLGGRMARLDLFGHQMRDDFGIGLALEGPTARGQFVAQRLEILDNAIVDQSDFARGMRMRVARRRRAMRRPAGMRDADIARRIVGFQHFTRLASLPSARRRTSWPPDTVQTPAESYPRYSIRFSPSTRRSATDDLPTIPMMPHM